MVHSTQSSRAAAVDLVAARTSQGLYMHLSLGAVHLSFPCLGYHVWPLQAAAENETQKKYTLKTKAKVDRPARPFVQVLPLSIQEIIYRRRG